VQELRLGFEPHRALRLPAVSHTFLPVIAIVFLFFYEAGLIGWAILFALPRSEVHQLPEIASEQK